MRKLYIRWLLPILAMLLVITALALMPLIAGAARRADTTPTPTPIVSPTATPSSTPSGVQPNVVWHW